MTFSLPAADDRTFLEICIPTYNRREQLARLLDALADECSSANGTMLRITISDNGSTDDTSAVVAAHRLADRVVYRRNQTNVGPLRNIWSLLAAANADYVWIFSDDDMPARGVLPIILDTLRSHQPDVLTFEFEQPLGSGVKRHGNAEGTEVILDIGTAVGHLLILAKLSKYVFRGTELAEALRAVEPLRDTGYGWLAVILEVLQQSKRKKVVLCHDFLATCDEHFQRVADELTPQYWDDYKLLLRHPIVASSCPEFVKAWQRKHNSYMVSMIYSVLAGITETGHIDRFADAGRNLPFEFRYFKNPYIFLQWLSLRFGIAASKTIYDGAFRFWRYTFAVKQRLRSIIRRRGDT